METKQVIVIRKDLKMRRGKEIAQGKDGGARVRKGSAAGLATPAH